jgi:hypothetical protein
VPSQLVRSLTSDPLLDLLVNQSKESEPEHLKGCPRTGFLVHYLALTFSTLLSSQVSGAHRAGHWVPAWGNSANPARAGRSSQIVSSAPSQPVGKP